MDKADSDRKLGREWAEEEHTFILTQSKEFQEGYLRQVKRMYSEVITSPYTMTEEEAIKFEAQGVEFGTYRGWTWGVVPTDYIEWLVDQGRELLKYVKSQRFKERED